MKSTKFFLLAVILASLARAPRAEANPAAGGAVLVAATVISSLNNAVQALKTGLDLAREQYCTEIRQIIKRTIVVTAVQNDQRKLFLQFAKDFDEHTLQNIREDQVELYATVEKHRQKGREAHALCQHEVGALNQELDATAAVIQSNARLLKNNIGSEMLSDRR